MGITLSQSNLSDYSNEWRDTLYTLYWIEGLRLRDIAQKLGYSLSYIHSQFKKLEIPTKARGGYKKIDWNKKDLHRLYWEEGMSLEEIGEYYGVHDSVVYNHMKKLGVETRKNTPQLHLTKDELYNLYWSEELSLSEIGEKYGFKGVTILKYLKKYGIPTRNPIPPTDISRDELNRLYWDEGLNTTQIAEKYGVHHGTISRILTRYDIPIRNLSEMILNIKEQRMKEITVDEELMSLVDGLLLGDGCVAKDNRGDHCNGYLTIDQRIDRVEWLDFIQTLLLGKGIKSNQHSYKNKSGFLEFPTNNLSLVKPTVRLYTEYLPLFREQRERWYPNGKKVIPKDIRLTPLSLAMWYLGDGSLNSKSISISLHTCGFTTGDVQYLSQQLKKRYCIDNKVRIKHHGPTIYIPTIGTQIFLDLIKPYYLSCFGYKFIKKEVEEHEVICER